MQVAIIALVLALLPLGANAEETDPERREALVQEYCSRDSLFRRSDGAILAPNTYLDGMLERETDLAIWRMKNIIRMYRPEFFTYKTQLEMWMLDQGLFVWASTLLGNPPLTPDYYMYKQFTEHREKLAQMFKEIAEELCPAGREYCGIGKHYWTDTAARALRSQADGLLNTTSKTGFETQMQVMAGEDYYKVCKGTAKDWLSID